MRKQCPQLIFFELNTVDTSIKSFIHSFSFVEAKEEFIEGCSRGTVNNNNEKNYRQLDENFSALTERGDRVNTTKCYT